LAISSLFAPEHLYHNVDGDIYNMFNTRRPILPNLCSVLVPSLASPQTLKL
jgi:hypothetical protein